MSEGWLTTMKPSFQREWLALPAKESRQILEKIGLLAQDPTPDAKAKKRLKYMGGKLHRMRSGDYRILYTFEHPYVSLLALRRRDDDTYDEDIDAEFLGGLDPWLGGAGKALEPDWEHLFARKEPEKTPLPEPITLELLQRLRVPEVCFPRLVRVETREDLLDCPGIADEIKLQVDEYLFERPLVERFDQPDLLTGDVSDLLRFKDGELIPFLLKLDPSQNRVVGWGLKASGPTLVKGSPGTGKSTVALYRAQAMIRALRATGIEEPRILFTTYTNALVSFSEQLLKRLLGADAVCVDVRTADSLAMRAVGATDGWPKIIDAPTLHHVLKQAIAGASFAGNALEQGARAKTLERLSAEYLIEEIGSVIEARGIQTINEYLEAPRAGRKVRLDVTQRCVVWQIYLSLSTVLRGLGLQTWQQVHRRAAEIVRSGIRLQRYDGVIVDEAQDLDPALLRMLVGLCAASNRIFITADANQSIYSSGFRWTDVHQDLRFQGRTALLRVNHRSTREIGEAAAAYLREGAVEPYETTPEYILSGPLPAMRAVRSADDEGRLLAAFLPRAAHEFRFGLGACAVLVPSAYAGQDLAARLKAAGVASAFMPGKALDLEAPCVKILTLQSAKGLEFPVVAVAGFLQGGRPHAAGGVAREEAEEASLRERRTLFVAMTRAMRALLVVTPADNPRVVLTGFDATYWNLGSQILTQKKGQRPISTRP